MSDSASAAQLRALLSEHTRRANRYLLVNAVSGAALGGAVAFGLAAQVGPEPVWRYPLIYVLWAITFGSIFWIARRRWWTVASAAYRIDRAHACDNLLRAAWLGMQRPQPGAFLEVNLRRACLVAAQFRPAPPWPLCAWYAGRDWAYTHKRALLNGLFYLILLLLFLLWLYFLLNRASQDARRNGDPRAASGQSPQGADRAGSAGERTPSGSSPPAGTSPTEGTTPAGRPGSSASKAADAGARQTHAEDGARRAGAGPAAGKEKTAGAGSDSAARGGDSVQKGGDASGAAAANRPSETNSDRPGTASFTHAAGGTAPAAAGDKRLVVMPGMNTAGPGAQHSAAPRAPKNRKTSAQQQEAEEVRPPGRVPREYERFLRNP